MYRKMFEINVNKIQLILIICVLGMSCTSTPEETQNEELEQLSDLPSGFKDFYDRFHSDSIYQLQHIMWPLSSKVFENRERSYQQFWDSTNWKVHHAFAEDDELYQQEFRVVDDRLLTELIYLKIGGFAIERRFAFIDTAWYLILYNEYHSDENDSRRSE